MQTAPPETEREPYWWESRHTEITRGHLMALGALMTILIPTGDTVPLELYEVERCDGPHPSFHYVAADGTPQSTPMPLCVHCRLYLLPERTPVTVVRASAHA